MKRLLIHIAIFVFIAKSISAQDPHFTQINRAPSFYNPAAAGNGVEDIRLTMLYRNQWASVTTPFVTQGFFFDKQVGKVGLGANLVNNSAGDAAINQLLLNGILNYRFDFNKNHFTTGMQVGLMQKSFDPSKMTFDDQFLPDQGYNAANATAETFSYTKVTRPDLGLGVFWSYGKPGSDRILPFAGFSVQHMLQPKETFILDANTIPIKLNAQLGLGIHVNDEIQITPSVLYVKQQNSSELVAGAVVRLPLQERSMVEGGIYYRYGDAMAIYGGYQWNNFLLGASYDVNISGITRGPGAFELTLTYIPKAKIKQEPEKKSIKKDAVKKHVPVKKNTVVTKPIETKQESIKATVKKSPLVNIKATTKTEAPSKPKSIVPVVKITATAQSRKPKAISDSANVLIPDLNKVTAPAIKASIPAIQQKAKLDSVVVAPVSTRTISTVNAITSKSVVINKETIIKPTAEIIKPIFTVSEASSKIIFRDVEEITTLNLKPIIIDKSSFKKPSVKLNINTSTTINSNSSALIERQKVVVKEIKLKPISIDKNPIKNPILKICIPLPTTNVNSIASIRDESEIVPLQLKPFFIDRITLKKPISRISILLFNRADLISGNDLRKEAPIKGIKIKGLSINKNLLRKPAAHLQLAPDSDLDGVDDRIDNCLTQKGSIKNLGCPVAANQITKEQTEKLPIKAIETAIEENTFEIELNASNSLHMGAIEFEKGKSESHGIYKLDVIEPALDSAWFNTGYSIVLTGHTYHEVDSKMTIELSKARVETVKAIFVKKGIAPSRIIAVPYGERKPATLGENIYDIAKNRRVEVYILKSEK